MSETPWTDDQLDTLGRMWWNGASLSRIDKATGSRCSVERMDADTKYQLLHRIVYGWLSRDYGADYRPNATTDRAGLPVTPTEVSAFVYMRQKEDRKQGSTHLDDYGYLARVFRRRPQEMQALLNPPEQATLFTGI